MACECPQAGGKDGGGGIRASDRDEKGFGEDIVVRHIRREELGEHVGAGGAEVKTLENHGEADFLEGFDGAGGGEVGDHFAWCG